MRTHTQSNRTSLRQKAFTLIEMMVVVAILAILLAVAVPAMYEYLERNRANGIISEIRTLFYLARETAVRHNCFVMICPSDDSKTCSASQQAPLIVFSDCNRNLIMDEDDQLYRQLRPLPENSTLRWSFFGNKKYLQMTPQGWTNHQNGTLIYCPPSGREEHARILTIHKSGRVRFGRDTDGDNVVNKANGKNVEC